MLWGLVYKACLHLNREALTKYKSKGENNQVYTTKDGDLCLGILVEMKVYTGSRVIQLILSTTKSIKFESKVSYQLCL